MSNNIGAPKDSAATDITGAWSVISILKGILNGILNGIKLKLGATDISASNPLPTTKISDATATATVGNTTITTGGTSQLLFTAKTRKGYWIKNTSSADLTIHRGGGTATASNFAIPSGGYFETPAWENVSTKIEIYGATAGQTYQYGEYV